MRACFLASLASGILVVLLGNRAPYIFALCILPSSIAGSLIRPPSANLMLEQQSGDTGSMVSVIGCVSLLMGALGMTLISLPWGNTIIALGTMIALTGGVSLLAWPLVIRQAVRLPHPTQAAADLEASQL